MINTTNKSVLLGYNSKSQMYCILTVGFTWEWLEENIKYIDSIRFTHYKSNWGGSDDIVNVSNILRQNQLVIEGSKIVLPQSITFTGEDYDMGHTYKWESSFDTLIKVINKP